jgi:hypothetical protein
VVFHVEIRRGHRWAREFNLDRERLARKVLNPWAARETIRLGDRDWEPVECSLRILEGPELAGHDLAFGRGWDRAQRSGKTVTRELVAGAMRDAAVVAVHAETAAGREAIVQALGELGVMAVDRAREVSEADHDPMAMILAVETADPPRAWLYEAGAAVGSAGDRAVLVRLTDAPVPPELAELPTVRPGRDLAPALAEALAELGQG